MCAMIIHFYLVYRRLEHIFVFKNKQNGVLRLISLDVFAIMEQLQNLIKNFKNGVISTLSN